MIIQIYAISILIIVGAMGLIILAAFLQVMFDLIKDAIGGNDRQ